MARRAGCRVANLEFNQFHPTALYHRRRVIFLTGAAVAKAHTLNVRTVHGGLCRTLTNAGNWRRAILMPALLTIFKTTRRRPYVSISATSLTILSAKALPMIYAKLLDLGMDLTKEPIRCSSPHTIPAAAWSSMIMVVPDGTAYMPLAKSVTPACTALTVWRPTR